MFITKKHLLKIANIAITFLAIYLVVKYILPYFIPFIIGLILSIFIEPMVKFLQRRFRLGRGPAVGISLVMSLGSIILIFSLLIVRLTTELIGLSGSLPVFFDQFSTLLIAKWKSIFLYYETLPDNVHDVINQYAAAIQKNLVGIASTLQDFTTNLANSFLTTISKLPTVLAIILVALLATFFISRDRSKLINYWYDVLPYQWADRSLRVLKDITNALMGYFKAQMILISITMVQSIIGLYIIGSEYALLMGMVIGFFDFLPVLGPSTVFLPWVAWDLLNGNTTMAIKLSVLWVMIMVVRQLLEAKIVSASIGLHPLLTLMAMYVGLKGMGVIGLILGPIAVIAIQAVWKAGFINLKFK